MEFASAIDQIRASLMAIGSAVLGVVLAGAGMTLAIKYLLRAAGGASWVESDHGGVFYESDNEGYWGEGPADSWERFGG